MCPPFERDVCAGGARSSVHALAASGEENDLRTFNPCDQQKSCTLGKDNKQSNMENDAEAAVGVTMPTHVPPESKMMCPSRNTLQTRRACPCCKVTMTYHSLLYKHHKCRGTPDLKEKKMLERMDARIQTRLGPRSEVGLDCPQATPG